MIDLSNISIADKILYFFILLVFLIMISVAIVLYFKAWKQNLRYVKMEVRRAGNEREIKHWKRELRIVYWSVIPGLTIRRIKKILRFLKKDKKRQ